MSDATHPWMNDLNESSAALREVLGAVIRSEQQYHSHQSPLAALRRIQEDPPGLG